MYQTSERPRRLLSDDMLPVIFHWNCSTCHDRTKDGKRTLFPEGEMDALLSIILSSPPSSSSSSPCSSSSGFHRSCAARLGLFARSTARSASIRAVESSFCFCNVASRWARTRASSGRYSLASGLGKSNDQKEEPKKREHRLFVFLARGFYSLEEIGETVACHAGYAN